MGSGAPSSSRAPGRRRAPWVLVALAALAALFWLRVQGELRPSSSSEHGSGRGLPSAPAVVPAAPEPTSRPPTLGATRDPSTRRAFRLGILARPGMALALGKGRLAVLGPDAMVVHEGPDLQELTRIPLAGSRAVVALPDGSLVGIGGAESVRLMAHDREARRHARIPLLPLGAVLPDRVTSERVWVLGGTTLFGHTFGPAAVGGHAPIALWRELPEFDGRAIETLRDGSFIYTTAAGLLQFHGAGEPRALVGVPGKVQRILPGSRPDTVWLLQEARATLYRILAGKLVELVSVEPAAPVIDAAASGQLLGLLELKQPRDAPWSFVVEVFDHRGKRLLQGTLAATLSEAPDWAERLLDDRSLVLSSDAGLLVVGGPRELHPFDVHKGERIPRDR